MKRPRPGVGSELLPVALILFGLAGTLALVIAAHRNAAVTRRSSAARATVVATPPPPPRPVPPALAPVPPTPVAVAAPEPELEPEPAAPVEDPTKKALGRIAALLAENRQAARDSDRRAAALDIARKEAEDRTREWRRREAIVKSQVEQIESKAGDLESEADALAMERDVLARERDAAKAAYAKAMAKEGGYAVLPHKNASGTWQRPVVVECRDGTVTLQPNGPTVSLVEMSPRLGPRANKLVVAVARELIRIHRSGSPDGEAVVPYIFFIIRPDGIRPYYEARGRLEPLGIAFGYELVDQGMEIDFPDIDALATWDGTNVPRTTGGPGGDAVARNDAANFVWPSDRRRGPQNVGGAGTDGAKGGKPEDYVWSRGGGTGTDGGTADESAPDGTSQGKGAGAGGYKVVNAGPGGAPPRLDQLRPSRALREGLAAFDDLDSPGTGRPGANAAGGFGVGNGASVQPTPGGTGHGFGGGGGVIGGPTVGSTGSGTGSTGAGSTGTGRTLFGPSGNGTGGSGSRGSGTGGAGFGPTTDPGGLVPIQPSLLPGFDSTASGAGGATGLAGAGTGGVSGGSAGTTAAGMTSGVSGGSVGSAGTTAAGMTGGVSGGSVGSAGTTAAGMTGGVSGDSAGTTAAGGTGGVNGAAGGMPPVPYRGSGSPGVAGTAGGATGDLPPLPQGFPNGGRPAVPDGAGDLAKLAPFLQPGGGDNSATGQPGSAAPNGRVRIDPESVATEDDPFGDRDAWEDSGNGGSAPNTGQGSAGGPSGSSGSTGGGGQTGQQGLTPAGLASGTPPTGTPSASAGGASPMTGGVGQPSASGGQSGPIGIGMPSFGGQSASSSPTSGDVRPRRSTAKSWTPSRETIVDAPLDLVVACERDGVVIHPGGYRLSMAALKRPGALSRDLETIVQNHALIDPSVRPKPRVQFLIEPGGTETYQEARRRTILSGMSWPVTLRVAVPPSPTVFPKERF